jgi:hypothetical protein
LRAEVDFLRPTSSDPYRMGDFFVTKLPVGHAIRTMTRAAADTSLSNEPAFGAVVAPGVDEARRRLGYSAMFIHRRSFRN